MIGRNIAAHAAAAVARWRRRCGCEVDFLHHYGAPRGQSDRFRPSTWLKSHLTSFLRQASGALPADVGVQVGPFVKMLLKASQLDIHDADELLGFAASDWVE